MEQIWLYWHYNRYSKEWGPDISLHEKKDSTDVLIRVQQIEFPEQPPRKLLVPATLAGFRAEQSKIRADAAEQVAEIEQYVGELLALEYKPEAQNG